MNTGVDFVGIALNLAVGHKVAPHELKPRYNKFVCQRYLMRDKGITISDITLRKVLGMSGIEYGVISNQGNKEEISPINSNGWRAIVIATGVDRTNAQLNASNAISEMERQSWIY